MDPWVTKVTLTSQDRSGTRTGHCLARVEISETPKKEGRLKIPRRRTRHCPVSHLKENYGHLSVPVVQMEGKEDTFSSQTSPCTTCNDRTRLPHRNYLWWRGEAVGLPHVLPQA